MGGNPVRVRICHFICQLTHFNTLTYKTKRVFNMSYLKYFSINYFNWETEIFTFNHHATINYEESRVAAFAECKQ